VTPRARDVGPGAGRFHPLRPGAAGIALFHNRTLLVALTGLAVITAYKLLFTGFAQGPGVGGLGLLAHEW
jgi:hypothetical protein